MNETPEPDNAPVDAALASLEPGFLVGNGRFTLIRLIGRGGMGVVWLARDESLREDVALKFLPSEIRFDAVALDDLRRETARARKLTHPNIIRIHDLYKDEREAFISMEYIDGPNLSDLRLEQSERVFTWQYLEPLIKQLCEALDYAHSEKVVHRDLKPANMMLDSRGRLKLSDFGIAAQVSDSVTRVSMIRHSQSGTSTYMSPQQMDGKLPQVTDDIHALGATLYELLTSRPPFFTGDIAYQVRNLPPQPMAERLAELGLENPVPSPVAAMIMACLGKSPEQRPQTARAVADWIGLPAATSGPTTGRIIATPPAPKPAEQRKTSIAPVAPKPPTTLEPAPPEPDTAAHEEFTIESTDGFLAAQTDAPTRRNTSLLVTTVVVLIVASLGTGAAMWRFFRARAESKPETAVAKPGDTLAVPAAIELTNIASTPAPASNAPTAARAPATATPAPTVSEFVNLFNGRDLTGWSGDHSVWSVVDGSIRGRLTQATSFSKPSVLVWRGGMVEDFELRASFRLPQAGRAGVFYRAKELPGFDAGGYQYEIGRGNLGSLAELGNDRQSRDLKRFLSGNTSASTWHELTITVVGRRITHALDGVVVLEVNDNGENPPSTGLIALKVTSGPATVEFKNIRIKRFRAVQQGEASPTVNGKYESIFNGRDLSEWLGNQAVWSVKDGVIRAETTGRKTGTCLFWAGGELADFELRFRFRVLRGNSGVFYRAKQLNAFAAGGYQFDIANTIAGNLIEVGEDRRRRDLCRVTGNVQRNFDIAGPEVWHEAAVLASGSTLVHTLDGTALCTVHDLPTSPRRGFVALEATAFTTVEFKDIQLRLIKPAD